MNLRIIIWRNSKSDYWKKSHQKTTGRIPEGFPEEIAGDHYEIFSRISSGAILEAFLKHLEKKTDIFFSFVIVNFVGYITNFQAKENNGSEVEEDQEN